MGVLDFASRIIMSLILGMFIGFERQLTGHPAGIRTNILICLGSCMFLLFPMIMESDDIQRVASYIVSGVGFLCSGVIFKEKGTVKGLNTAATLWCSAAIGVLCSSGMYKYAIISTLVLIMANVIFKSLSQKIDLLNNTTEEFKYKLIVRCKKLEVFKIKRTILNEIKKTNLLLIEISSKDLKNKDIKIEFICKITKKSTDDNLEKIVSKLSLISGVNNVSWIIIN